MAVNGKRVLLAITGEAQVAGQTPDQIKLVTTGLLTPVAGGYQLDYQESQPDGSDVQDIRLTIESQRVTMTRTGDYGSTMVFEKGKHFQSFYHTPYGEMELAVYPTKVSVQAGDGEGHVHLKYQLEFQGQYASMNELTLRYRQGAGH